MAMLGEASTSGVPALGLPKMATFVGGIFKPTFSASPLWSINAKSVTPFACKIPLSFSTVWSVAVAAMFGSLASCYRSPGMPRET
jgi:hypothetical protein